jgi:DNA-binding transcriptional ArsR family regulator
MAYHEAMDVSSQFPALADGTRRAVFEALAAGPRSVAELAAEFPVSRPAVSQHLKVLQDAGLVRFERDGTRNIYEIDPDGLASLRDYLDGLWTRALRDLKSLAESTYRPKHRSKR